MMCTLRKPIKWIITRRGPVGPSQYAIEGRESEIGVIRVQHPTAIRPYTLAGPAVPADLVGRTYPKLASAKSAAESALATLDLERAVAAAYDAITHQLGLSIPETRRLFGHSGWRDISDMAQREFAGDYRGYYPKGAMWLPAEAVVAIAFDALAQAYGDDRRALRNTSGGDLTRRASP